MDRDRLARLLEHDGEAFVACRRAVLAGGRFWVEEHPQPAPILVAIYARRDRRTRQREIPTLGFTHAVDDLRACRDDLVRLGAVDLDDPPYHFQLFLNEEATTVVACLGVDQSWKRRRQPIGRTPADTTASVHDEFPNPR